MQKLLNSLAVTGLAFGLATPGFAQSADDVLVTVNGTDITLGHVIVLRERLPEQYLQLPDDQLLDGIIQQLIQQAAIADGAGPETKRTTVILENERRALRAAEVIESAANDAVTDQALQAAYDANYGNADPTPEFNASHILVETEEEAQALITELDGGADFAELAKEKSTGPSGPNGGELGWFQPGQMVPTFDSAVQEMTVGDISAPVQTQFGWHVIKLNDAREQDAPSLDEVRGELSQQVQEEVVRTLIDETTSAATIDRSALEGFDASLIRNVELLEQ